MQSKITGLNWTYLAISGRNWTEVDSGLEQCSRFVGSKCSVLSDFGGKNVSKV